MISLKDFLVFVAGLVQAHSTGEQIPGSALAFGADGAAVTMESLIFVEQQLRCATTMFQES